MVGAESDEVFGFHTGRDRDTSTRAGIEPTIIQGTDPCTRAGCYLKGSRDMKHTKGSRNKRFRCNLLLKDARVETLHDPVVWMRSYVIRIAAGSKAKLGHYASPFTSIPSS